MKQSFIKGEALSKAGDKTKYTYLVASFLLLCFLTTSAKALDKKIVVAVIDTGVDIHHKDLKKSIWTNIGETGKDSLNRDKSKNGIDDDGNGYVDDLHGWNFVDDNNKVIDHEGHGTHVAGIIKKQFSLRKEEVRNSIAPSSSVAELQLMVLKYFNPKGSNQMNVINTIKAIHYATQMNAQVINYSAGGAVPEFYELQAIQNARKLGIIMVVAAGNENANTDENRYYPASYKLDNMISVAATEDKGGLTSFSNYGKNTVDIAAPGKLVFSTLPKNRYGVLSGTSQATAFVSGRLAAVMLNKNDGKTVTSYRENIENLYKEAVYKPELKGRTKFQLALLGEIP